MTDYIGPYELNSIITGDARELAKAIPDESIDLIFTDPVYDRIDDYRWLAETAARVLKPNKSILSFCGHSYTLLAGSAMLESGLKPAPILEHYIAGAIGRLFSHSLQCNVLPCLWLSKGLPDNEWMFIQQLSIPNSRGGHDWGKNDLMIATRLDRFVGIDSIVFDPFTGGGTVPAVCKMLGRRYLAFEIDPGTAERARERVRNTQPPLFVLQPEQSVMELSA